jgi:hypothetical protein
MMSDSALSFTLSAVLVVTAAEGNNLKGTPRNFS